MLALIAAGAMGVIVLFGPASAKNVVGARARAWVANVVERVEGAAAPVAAPTGRRKTRTIDVHIRISANGTVLDVAFGSRPLSETLETRLREAVVAVGPFGQPPNALLAPDGTTELDFTLDIPEQR